MESKGRDDSEISSNETFYQCGGKKGPGGSELRDSGTSYSALKQVKTQWDRLRYSRAGSGTVRHCTVLWDRRWYSGTDYIKSNGVGNCMYMGTETSELWNNVVVRL